MEILAFVLSTLGTICICVSPLLKGKNLKTILLLTFSSNVLLATSYLLTGAFNGAATCYIGAVQTIINYFLSRKNKPIPTWLIAVYAAAFLVVNILVFSSMTDIIALLAAMAFILGISQKSGKKYRLWTLVNTLLWIAYDLICLAFGPLSTHVIFLGTVIAGMVMHDRKKETV